MVYLNATSQLALEDDGNDAKEEGRGREEAREMKKTAGEGRSGGEKQCVFLRTMEINLPIVRRWKIRIENYWRVIF